jgi:antitoxin ParD1/3/4
MTARARRKGEESGRAGPEAEPLDSEFRRLIRESLDDPRPDIPAEEVFASLRARHEARLKRGS